MDQKIVGARLRQRRKVLGWTAQKLAVLCEIDPSFVSRIELGKAYPSQITLQKMAGALGLSLDKLYLSQSNVVPAVADFRSIPLLDYVQAGQWRTVDATMKDEWMREAVPVNMDYPPSVFALRISGDSMEPRFRAGDVVVVDPTLTPRPGDFVIATNESGDATFKQYRSVGKSEKGQDVFELVPLNPNYAPMRSDREAIGIVGVMREHRVYSR